MDTRIELAESKVDYLTNPRQTLETLADLKRQAGLHPEQTDKSVEIIRVVGEITRQLDLQGQNDLRNTEVSSKAA